MKFTVAAMFGFLVVLVVASTSSTVVGQVVAASNADRAAATTTTAVKVAGMVHPHHHEDEDDDLLQEAEFLAWTDQHDKTYDTLEETQLRLGIWRENNGEFFSVSFGFGQFGSRYTRFFRLNRSCRHESLRIGFSSL